MATHLTRLNSTDSHALAWMVRPTPHKGSIVRLANGSLGRVTKVKTTRTGATIIMGVEPVNH